MQEGRPVVQRPQDTSSLEVGVDTAGQPRVSRDALFVPSSHCPAQLRQVKHLGAGDVPGHHQHQQQQQQQLSSAPHLLFVMINCCCTQTGILSTQSVGMYLIGDNRIQHGELTYHTIGAWIFFLSIIIIIFC